MLDEKELEEREAELKSFVSGLLELEDSRISRNKCPSLQEIFLLILCAQLNGFETFRDYVLYGEMKLSFLRRFCPYQSGVPSRSTLARVLALFCPKALEALFRKWIQVIVQVKSQEIIAIDGKTHRGYQPGEDESRLHLVHACATSSGVVLGQEAVKEKSNEITAIPELIDAVVLAGQLVTIDAMGCQRKIAEKLVSKKADYLLGLKGNQSSLHADIKLYFENETLRKACVFVEENDKGHGRVEHREAYITDKINWLTQRQEWKGLRSIIQLNSSTYSQGKDQNETRYYISSLPASEAKLILQATRAHWGVESMHWTLDVTFKEDSRIIWNRNVAQNEGIIRRVAMNLLKQYQLKIKPLRGKEKIALKSIRKILLADDEAMYTLLHGNL
jgi:predicted transposase YbfD/YdcC